MLFQAIEIALEVPLMSSTYLYWAFALTKRFIYRVCSSTCPSLCSSTTTANLFLSKQAKVFHQKISYSGWMYLNWALGYQNTVAILVLANYFGSAIHSVKDTCFKATLILSDHLDSWPGHFNCISSNGFYSLFWMTESPQDRLVF